MLLLVVVLGLCLGSFINAWTWRLKVKKSVASGRSMCPHCRHQLAWYDLLPLLSWLLLRGRCRYCRKPISVQYPLVELLTAGLFTLSYLAWDVGSYLGTGLLVIWLLQLVLLITLALYDLKHLLLPDKVMRWLLLASLAQLLVLAVFQPGGWDALNHLLAGVVGGGFFYALFAISGGKWMGGGDVKLVFVMGLMLGLPKLLVALFLAFNLAAFVSLGLILGRRLSRRDLIPFGPFLITATVVATLYGQSFVNWYLNLMGFG